MELGATLCLPGDPHCHACPIRGFCATQSRGERIGPSLIRNKREVTRCLSHRANSLLLIQRPADDRLMPGMWELPEVRPRASDLRLFTVRHSITVTDYAVHVVSRPAAPVSGKWLKVARLSRLPLTGLTKKILLRAKII
jgi:A/G-specific adenine glycosylase